MSQSTVVNDSSGSAHSSQSNAPASGLRPVNAAGETVAVNPATLEEIARVPNTDLATMPEIFARARTAQKAWAQTSFAERRKYANKMRDYIVAHAEELAES